MSIHPLSAYRPDHSEGNDTDAPVDPADDQLMWAIREGDEGALDTLMERHWTPLLKYALRRVGRRDRAEDIAQQVFVRVWANRREWSGKGSPKAYLYRTARNLVVDHVRHDEVRRRTAPRVRRTTRRTPTPLDEMVHTELRDAFELALSNLPSRRREAFLLVRFQGLSLKEAAGVMEVTPRTVANHVYLAATDLTDALAPHLS